MVYESEYSDEAPFNFAIATLMRLDDILKKILMFSTNANGSSQHVKYRLVRQLFFQSAVLIKDIKVKNKLMAKLITLEPKHTHKTDDAGRVTGTIEYYDHDINNKLDEYILEIQEALQKSGSFFMPKKSESSLF